MGEAILTTRPSSGGSNSGGSEAIGDIITTSRTIENVGENYILCDGRYISSDDYPDLTELLNTNKPNGYDILYSFGTDNNIKAFYDPITKLFWVYRNNNSDYMFYAYDNILDFLKGNDNYATTISTENIIVPSYIYRIYNNNALIYGTSWGSSSNRFYIFDVNTGTLSTSHNTNTTFNHFAYVYDDILYEMRHTYSSSQGSIDYIYIDDGSSSQTVTIPRSINGSYYFKFRIVADRIFISGNQSSSYYSAYTVPLSSITNTSSWTSIDLHSDVVYTGNEWLCKKYNYYNTSSTACEVFKYTGSSSTSDVVFTLPNSSTTSTVSRIIEDNSYIYICTSDTYYKLAKNSIVWSGNTITTALTAITSSEFNNVGCLSGTGNEFWKTYSTDNFDIWNNMYITFKNPPIVKNVPSLDNSVIANYIRAK